MPAAIGVTRVTTPSDEGPRRPDGFQLFTAIGSPVALGTALLLYFGWVRSQAQAVAFGADVSVFEMSPQDLVLRSIDVLFFPIILLLLGGLLLIRVDPWLQARASRIGPMLRYAWVLAPVGLALRAVTEPQSAPDDVAGNAVWVGDVLLPLFVLLAIGGVAYGSRLRRRAIGDRRPTRFAQVVLVVALLTVALFWQTERLARLGGDERADDLKHRLAQTLPAVSVFSAGRLHVDGFGVTEEPLPGSDGAFRYRYDGLYLLQRSGDKYFLLTDGWRHDDGRLIVLADTDAIRLEFGG